MTDYQGENLISEILRLGIQSLMELERDEHIGVGSYERGDERQSYRNGYKSRTLYTSVGPLVLQGPQTRDGAFYPSILERYQRHFTVNVMDRDPKSRHDDLYSRLKEAWTAGSMNKPKRSWTSSRMITVRSTLIWPILYRNTDGRFLGCTTHARWNTINGSGQQT